MVIKVDLQCPRCLKKIKEIFGEYPQIRDQIYYEQQNAVLITVVRCSPEKIRQDIKRKGGKFVESVEILPYRYTKKPKKVFIELPKETAKTPAPAPVPAPPRKATKAAPLKPTQQAPALPRKATKAAPLKPTKAAPLKPTQQAPALPRKATKAAPLKPTQQAPALPPPKEVELVVGYAPEAVHPMEQVYPLVLPSYGGYGGGPCYLGRSWPVMGDLMDVGDQLMSGGLGIEVPILGWGDERRALMDVKVGIEAMMDLEARLMSVKVGIEVPIQGRGGQRCYDGRGRPADQLRSVKVGTEAAILGRAGK